MIRVSQKEKETLKNALEYLEGLYAEFVSEIEAKTIEIRMHQDKRRRLSQREQRIEISKSFLQKWRRESFALHQRRSTLKDMKDCLDRQIKDVKTALSRLDRIAHLPPARNNKTVCPAGRPGWFRMPCA